MSIAATYQSHVHPGIARYWAPPQSKASQPALVVYKSTDQERTRFPDATAARRSSTAAAPALWHAALELYRLIVDLVSHGEPLPSKTAIDATRLLLRKSLDVDSVYPSISDDGDGGLYVEWRASKRHILVEISRTGSYYLFATDDDGYVVYEGDDPHYLRRQVKELTTVVNDANPTWRSLF